MSWDRNYERRAVPLLAVGFGLVGLDRFIIMPLFPVIAEDLGLTYQDLGLISGILALTWGIASVFCGNLADRIGCKRVLVGSIILFSALVATSGLATGLASFLLIRGLMGFAEGGFVPASIVATVDASKPTRTGFMVGIQQMAAPLVGLGFGPLIAIGLLKVVPGWEWVFAIVALPGFLVAWLTVKTIRAPERAPQSGSNMPRPSIRDAFAQAFRCRNVVFGTLGMLCFLSSLHTLSAFMPNYLTDHVGMPLDRMGMVLSALGAGGVVGMLSIPYISDRVGRKPVMIVSMLCALVALTVIVFGTSTATIIALALFSVSAAISGVVAITVGPLVNSSVPATIAATATGIVAGLGEAVGGAVAPAVAGALAQAQGIQVIPVVSLFTACLGLLIVSFGLREPDPKILPEHS